MRIAWIDSTKGLAIFGIVLGHFSNIATEWVYLFHLPIFFFLGGVLVYSNNEVPFFDVVKKKFKSLMWAFYKYSFLLLPYWLFIERFYRPSGEFVQWQYSFLGLIFANGNQRFWLSYGGAIWFLPIYFITVILFDYLLRFFNDLYLVISLFTILLLGYYFAEFVSFNLPFGANISFITLFWYGAGYICNKYNLINYLNNANSYSLLGITLLLFYFTLQSNLILDLYSLQFGNNIISLISDTLISIFFIASLGALLKNLKILTAMGSASLAIMALHQPIARIMLFIASKLSNVPITVIKNSYWSVFFCLLVVFVILGLGLIEKRIHKKLNKKYLLRFKLFY